MNSLAVSFNKFKRAVKGKEGLVCTGCGGPISEWIKGVTKAITSNGIAKGEAKDLWGKVYMLKTTGGRIDIAFVFKDNKKFDIGKMAMWRLQFGGMSWISDYVPNYADHF